MRAHEFADQGAAGIVLYAEDTGRYGLQQRSETVNDAGLWAAWGGGREPGETLEQCARRELAEEGGYTGPIQLQRLGENSRYVTFLGRVPHEFEPREDSEWQDYCWVKAGDWPAPMHPGTAAALQNIHKDTINEKINRDIRNRRFEHSQRIGDYTYKATVEIFMGNPLLWIKAYHGKKEIGHILFELYSDHLQSGGTEVDPNYRNKGVASAMYAYAKMLGNDIKPSYIRTDQGKGMWAAWEKSGDAKHLGPEVKENFADGKNPIKFTVSSLDGYQHSFQITLAVHGKHVGHFNFVRSADTDDVNNEAEVEQRWQGQGYGKLLLMKAIDVANNHGLDFQQDIRGITDAQQNVYDSLENAGLIVTPGDGFWFLTPQGEQELNGLNENFADGKNPGRKGLSKRVGVNTKASVSSLRKTAKNSSGEKQRMAHWLANMKAGRAKAKRK